MDDFNAVAADNPYSWFPTRRDATEIATPTPENRWVCFPYPKFLNANNDVDMAAALIETDAQTARDAGIASDEVAHVRGNLAPCWRCARAGKAWIMMCPPGECACDYQVRDSGCAGHPEAA